MDGMHLMAPPKELVADDEGRLRLKRFAGFEALTASTLDPQQLVPLQAILGNPSASAEATPDLCHMACEGGMEIFLLQGEYDDFLLSGDMYIEGKGKCGLVLRVNEQGDGYFLSLDLYKGIAQLRAWGHNPEGGHEGAFHYQQLQTANFLPTPEPHRFSLLAHGQYLELSLNDFVVLSLADDQFTRGRIGFYAEGAKLRVERLTLNTYTTPTSPDYPETLAGL